VRYVFLTACRNEEKILDEFLEEFNAAVTAAGVAQQSILYVVDDFSVDGSRGVLARYAERGSGVPLRMVEAPTNLGNQGAMFYGLSRIDAEAGDVLITLDCDGEDDVRQLQSIIELGRANDGKLVLIERGRRTETLLFKVFFAGYKILFRFFTRQRVVPNNFMLIPGRFLPAIKSAPLAAVHFAYAILRLGLPYVVVTRDRRSRYGGRTSQNIFTLVSHGLVGLMAFYETVIAKLFLVVLVFGGGAAAVVAAAISIPAEWLALQRTLLWSAVAAAVAAAGLFALLMAAGFALVFKVTVFNLTQIASDRTRGLEAGDRSRKPPVASSAGKHMDQRN